MIKIAKNFGIILLASFISINGFAEDELNSDDYDADYYEGEGNLVFKMKVDGVKSDATQTGLPKPTVANPVSIGGFAQNGYGFGVSTSVFFADNFAAELSLDYIALCIKNSNLANIAYNYGGNPNNIGKRRLAYMMPITLTGQYHMAPFGGVRPYVGAGYSGAYFFSKSKGATIKNGYGPVVQVGVDFYAKDYTLINAEIKQYFLASKANYKTSLTNGQSVKSKIKWNPLVFSAGVGFRF